MIAEEFVELRTTVFRAQGRFERPVAASTMTEPGAVPPLTFEKLPPSTTSAPVGSTTTARAAKSATCGENPVTAPLVVTAPARGRLTPPSVVKLPARNRVDPDRAMPITPPLAL